MSKRWITSEGKFTDGEYEMEENFGEEGEFRNDVTKVQTSPMSVKSWSKKNRKKYQISIFYQFVDYQDINFLTKCVLLL